MKLENAKTNSFWYFLNLFQLTVLKTFLNLLDSKEIAREQLLKSITLFNSFCFWLSIFPFLWFICRLPASVNRSVTTMNLPGLSQNLNEITCETLLSPLDYNTSVLNNLEHVNLSDNQILLKHSTLDQSIGTLIQFYSDKNLSVIKEFKPRDLTKEELKKQSFLPFVYDLDEIPYKLESTTKKSAKNKTTGKSSNLTTLVELDPNDLNPVTLKTSASTQEQKNFKVAITKEKNRLKLIKTQLKLSSGLPVSEVKKDNRTSDWINFSLASELFQNQYRNQLLKTLNSEVISKNNILDTRPRLMTWYQHPDMTSESVWYFKASQFFTNNNNWLTRCTYPSSIYLTKDRPSFISQPIAVPVYDISFQTTDGSTLAFIQHSLEDSDLSLKNKLVFQKQFLENGIKNNFETINPLYFFANLTKAGIEDLLSFSSSQNLFSEKQTNNLKHNVVNSPILLSLPDANLTTAEIKEIYDLNAANNESLLIRINDFRNGSLVPVPQFFSTKNSKDFLVFLNNTEQEKARLLIDTLFKVEEFQANYSANQYKREIGTYWKNSITQTEEFLTRNQTLSFNSIFSFSLVGFLLSTFLILKSAYADYAREFSSYLLDLISSGKGLPLDPSTIEWLNQELGIEEKKGGIRVFPKRFSKKRFTGIAGIKYLLPELSELVWFLRNKGRKFSVTRLTSKSVLLVGPPGTGKTLLVQALAAEAEVPVVAQSTSMLSSISQDLTPGDAIRMAFQKARTLAPCILFLDELDSLGLKRDSLLTSNSQQTNLFASDEVISRPFFEKLSNKEVETIDLTENLTGDKSEFLTNQLRINITNEFNQRKQQERDQVGALTQLLIEIDGVQANNGILVIGATNRPHVLDPALTRPGRFSKIIALPLPDKSKRIEIFKLYSKQLGWLGNVNWEYLAQRTKGFSAGDLAAVANQSAIQAILNTSKHSLETFENAIITLTTYPIEKRKVLATNLDPYYSYRETYYKVGQTLYNFTFNVENKSPVVELVSRDPNPRHYQILANVNNDKNRLRTRYELEKILTSLLAGKATEMLLLLTFTNKANLYWESDFGKKDIYEATKLVLMMTQDWYLYNTSLNSQKFINLLTNQNSIEYRKNEEVLTLLIETTDYLQQQLRTEFRVPSSESLAQKARWKSDVIQDFTNIDSLFAEWSRFHLPDPQETERNPEWIPPEEYYHENDSKQVKSLDNQSLSLTELALIERDRLIQTLLLTSFNQALFILEENRVLLDTLAWFLLKRKILRSFEISHLLSSKHGFFDQKTF